MIELVKFFDPSVIADFAWLGKQPANWLSVKAETVELQGKKLPSSQIYLHLERLARCEGVRNHLYLFQLLADLYTKKAFATIALIEMASALFGHGPKMFVPTEEQFEAMEQVTLDIPIADFTMPYPALIIKIPLGCRARLAKHYGLDVATAPKEIVVRNRREPGENPMVISHQGDPLAGRAAGSDNQTEVFYIFQHQEENPTIESALTRDADVLKEDARDWISWSGREHSEKLFGFGAVTTRAAMNLCLMLTHFGCEVQRPAKMNRAQRRAHEKHGDYLTVNMRQTITIRGPSTPTQNQPGPGTGVEMRPHWRKGHWRAYPNQACLRAQGLVPKLLFVRPVLVRSDRVQGDLAKSEVTYHG